MTTEKESCPHTKVGADSICKECGKRIIMSHKGGRTERISHRVLPEVKERFVEMAEQKKMKPADFLEYLINQVYKKV